MGVAQIPQSGGADIEQAKQLWATCLMDVLSATRRRLMLTMRSQQLFFTDMKRAVASIAKYGATRRASQTAHEPPAIELPCPGRLRLFEMRRDLLRFRRDRYIRLEHEVSEIPHLSHAWHVAGRLAEANGWAGHLRYDVQRDLVIALACRGPDELVLYSELVPLAGIQIPVERMASVLRGRHARR